MSMWKYLKPKEKKENEAMSLSSDKHEEQSESSVETCLSRDIPKEKLHRKFLISWLDKYPWLEYENTTDKAYCKICKKNETKNKKSAFTSKGFDNWKKAIERFNMHENSDAHRANLIKESAKSKDINVCSQMSNQHKKAMRDGRLALDKIISSIAYLARQGLALRGHTDESANFNQLLKLRSEDVPELEKWLKRTNYKWISHDIMNEIIEILAADVLKTILEKIQKNNFFAIMLDETSDISILEQVSMCIRTVDSENLNIEEYFIGFFQTPKTDAETLFTIVKDILIRCNLQISNLRGQCYDGASNVSGPNEGLQAKIRREESRALFVHCQAHSLNLVTQDCISNVNEARDILNFIRELITFLRQSPKRIAWFKSLQDDSSNRSLRPLCPTRWTLKHESLMSVLINYKELQAFFMEMSASEKNDAGSKAYGFLKQLQKSHTFFMLKIVGSILSHMELTNTALQSKALNFADSVKSVDALYATISSMRDNFKIIWKTLIEESVNLELEEPKEGRRRKIPAKLNHASFTSAEYSPPETAEKKYERIFIEIIDNVLKGLETRFETSTKEFLCHLEEFLLESNTTPDKICEFYGSDLCASRLKLHRDMFHDIIAAQDITVASVKDVIDVFNSEKLKHAVKHLTELRALLQIILTIPVSTCTSERSFSMLRRLKTYLRNNMSQKRLNNLAILNCHDRITESLDLRKLGNDFVNKCATRRNVFSMN